MALQRRVRPGADACTEFVGGADARTKSLADAAPDDVRTNSLAPNCGRQQH